MQPKQLYTNVATFLPSPKTARGYPASIDISQDKLLYFNSSVVVINQLNRQPIIIYHIGNVTAAAFNRDGRFVASTDDKGNLNVHLLLEDKAVLTKSIESCLAGSVKSICWTVDHKKVIVVGESKGTYGRVINVETGTSQGDLSGVCKTLLTVAVRSEQPYTIVVGGEESQLKFYQGYPYMFSKQESQHNNFVNQIRYNSDGSLLASVSTDKKLVLYDGKTGTLLKSKQNAHEAGIMGVDWISPSQLVTCSNDKQLKIWNQSLEEIMVLKIKDNPALEDFQVAVRASGEDIYSVSLNGNINYFKQPLQTKNCYPTDVFEGLTGAPAKLLIDSKENTFYVIDSSGKVCKHQLIVVYYDQKKNRLSTFKTISQNKMVFTGDYSHKTLYTLTGDGHVKKYDIPSKVEISEQKVGNYLGLAADPNCDNTYSLIGDKLVTTYKDGNKKDLKTDYQPSAIRYGPNSVLAVGTIKGFVYLYNADLTQINKISNSDVKVTSLFFDQQTLYVSDSNKLINAWDWKSEKKSELSLCFHTGLVYDFIVGNKTVLSGGVDNKIVLADKVKMSRLLELQHHHKRGVLGVVTLNDHVVSVGGDLLTRMIKLNDRSEF